MTIGSHTVVNVAIKDGSRKLFGTNEPAYVHFFRVILEQHPLFCKDVLADIQKKFPAPKYELRVTYWRVEGERFNNDGTND